MSAPDKIYAWPSSIYGMTMRGGLASEAVEYTRTDLTPPAADYVAGLEAAMSVYRDSLWREIMGGEGCLGKPCCVSPKGEGCDCQDKFARIETYANHHARALAARPASPDVAQDVQTRVVTVDQLERWADDLTMTETHSKESGWTYMASPVAFEIRAIIGETGQ